MQNATKHLQLYLRENAGDHPMLQIEPSYGETFTVHACVRNADGTCALQTRQCSTVEGALCELDTLCYHTFATTMSDRELNAMLRG